MKRNFWSQCRRFFRPRIDSTVDEMPPAMNTLYEGLKQNATLVIVPSTAVESMQLGGLARLTAMILEIQGSAANGQQNQPLSGFGPIPAYRLPKHLL
ncbi:MAG: peptidase [Firmicutes bacterium]|nr:peptidase [Bacillota bacterium]